MTVSRAGVAGKLPQGFARVPAAVIHRLPIIGPNGLAVYAVLSLRAGRKGPRKGRCWPSVHCIAKDLGLSPRTVQYALRRLEQAGLVARLERPGKATLYELIQNVQGVQAAAPLGVQEDAGRGATSCGGGVQPRAPRTREKNQKQEPQKESQQIPIPDRLDTPGFRAKWMEWQSYRRKVRKKPVSDAAARRQLEKLAKIGPELAAKTIDLSIENDWQGLFADRHSGRHRSPEQTPGLDDGRLSRYEGDRSESRLAAGGRK